MSLLEKIKRYQRERGYDLLSPEEKSDCVERGLEGLRRIEVPYPDAATEVLRPSGRVNED